MNKPAHIYPESKIQTYMRICAVLLALSLALSFQKDSFAQSCDLSAYPKMGVAVYEAQTMEPLVLQNEDSRYYPASTTKLLTVMLASEYFAEDDVITISDKMLSLTLPDSSRAGLVSGEKLSFYELSCAVLICSGNEAARAMAVAAGRNIFKDNKLAEQKGYDVFVKQMNTKALELKMDKSHFSNPDGYDDYDNYSTPNDMVKLIKAALEVPMIEKIVGLEKFSCKSNLKKHTWYNTDYFLHKTYDFTGKKTGANPYYDERVSGVKTGFTDIGGRCFALSASDPDLSIIGIAMALPEKPSSTLWKVCSVVIDYSFDNFLNTELITQDNSLQTVKIKNPAFLKSGKLTAAASNTLLATLTNEQKETLSYSVKLNEEYFKTGTDEKVKLKCDLEPGDKILRLEFFGAGEPIAQVDFITSIKVEKFGVNDALLYLLLIISSAAIVSAPIQIIRKKKLKEQRNGRKSFKNTRV